ncbi:MAG: hypothetical protein H0X33_05700 [Taibaiella sp.]|nr:hypothetical protein [Taibaiella sp.]
MIKKRTHTFRIIGAILGIILLVMAGISLYISLTYKKYIKEHLPEWVAKASDSVYHVSIQDISISLFTRQLTVTGIRLWPDTSCSNYHKETGSHHRIAVAIAIPKLEMKSIQWRKLISDKELACGEVILSAPTAMIISRARIVDSSRIMPEKKKDPAIKRIFASSIRIVAPNIAYKTYNKDDDSSVWTLKGGESVLNDWLLDPKVKDTTRFLLARSAVIDSAAFMFCKPSALYRFQAAAVYFNSEKNLLTVNKLKVAPIVDKETFYKIVGHRITIWNASVRKLVFNDINWLGLMHNKTLIVSSINMDEPDVSLYFSYYPPHKPGSMVHADPTNMLRHLPLRVHVNEVAVSNAHISYTELSEKSQREGTLLFDHVSLHAHNIINIGSDIARNHVFKAEAKGKFMKTSNITAAYQVSLSDSLSPFIIEGEIKDMHASQIDPVARALALISVDSGHVQEIKAHVHGNQNTMQCMLNILYTDLQAELEKSDGGGKMHERTILTAIANTFFVYHDNPINGKPPRTANVTLPRDPEVAYFAGIVKTVKLGTKEIVERHEKVVAILTNDKDAKREYKKGFFNRLFGKKKKK